MSEFSYNTAKVQFEKDIKLQEKFGTLENYVEAQKYELKTTSIHNYKTNPNTEYRDAVIGLEIERLEKKNAQSEVMIAKYEELKKVYEAMKNQSNHTINGLMSQYQVSNKNDLVSTFEEKNVNYDRGVYDKSVSTVSEAYTNFISALQTANYFTHKL